MSVAGARRWMKTHGAFKRGRHWYMTPVRLADEDRRASTPTIYRLETRAQLNHGRLAAAS